MEPCSWLEGLVLEEFSNRNYISFNLFSQCQVILSADVRASEAGIFHGKKEDGMANGSSRMVVARTKDRLQMMMQQLKEEILQRMRE